MDEFNSEFNWEFLDEIVELQELPQKKDYDEIRTFQDYEFTQCAIYELAIRDIRYQEEVDAILDFYIENKEDIDFIIDRDYIYEKSRETHRQDYIYNALVGRIKSVDVFNFKNEDLMNNSATRYYGEAISDLIDRIVIGNDKRYKQNRPLSNRDKKRKEAGIPIDNIKSRYSPRYFNKTREDGFIIKQTIMDWGYRSKSIDNLIKIGRIREARRNSSDVKERLSIGKESVVRAESIIYEDFKRPRINFNVNHVAPILSTLDLTKPESELIAYIQHVKKYISDHAELTVTPLDFLKLEDISDKSIEENNSISKKADLFADKLFVYDYILTRKNNLKKLNVKNEMDLEKKIETITNANSYEIEKNKEIKLAKKYEEEHKLSISERKLCLDNESSKYLKMTSSTIKKHFNDIKSLLKDGNYKKI